MRAPLGEGCEAAAGGRQRAEMPEPGNAGERSAEGQASEIPICRFLVTH